jgi:hypothetical protein
MAAFSFAWRKLLSPDWVMRTAVLSSTCGYMPTYPAPAAAGYSCHSLLAGIQTQQWEDEMLKGFADVEGLLLSRRWGIRLCGLRATLR